MPTAPTLTPTPTDTVCGSAMLRLSPRLTPRPTLVSSTEATAMLATPPTPTEATATGPTLTPTPMGATGPTATALATGPVCGSVRPRLSPRLRLMPVFSTEATATAMLVSPTPATGATLTPAPPTPLTATTGNSFNPRNVGGHHSRACWGIQPWATSRRIEAAATARL